MGYTMNLKLIIAAIAVISASAANANIIINGNFEAGSLAGWTALNNVQIVHDDGVSPNNFYQGAGNSQNGDWAALFNTGKSTPNGILSQSFATTIGKTYQVVFEFGVTKPGSAKGEQNLMATVSGTGANPLFSKTFNDTNPNTILKTFSFDFVANSVSSTLKFSDLAANGTDVFAGLLDNVMVDEVSAPAAAVPEPASLGLFGLGMAGLAALRRKRSA
ncbi:hypothetical protein CR103_12290 [Massilia psychrophila]|uniref:Ice-binding protein C-terminal domain-containing protein n=2 Tax=Massilia psychrophila TaxID=1603353 RepID=A0A2G8T0H4_9BURK|nr:hypothetical protein CR103_12290 [Massilia psychrophila]GGE79686.1 hypothetical protein GCM10008020_25570 [Massilia psychrophila]